MFLLLVLCLARKSVSIKQLEQLAQELPRLASTRSSKLSQSVLLRNRPVSAYGSFGNWSAVSSPANHNNGSRSLSLNCSSLTGTENASTTSSPVFSPYTEPTKRRPFSYVGPSSSGSFLFDKDLVQEDQQFTSLTSLLAFGHSTDISSELNPFHDLSPNNSFPASDATPFSPTDQHTLRAQPSFGSTLHTLGDADNLTAEFSVSRQPCGTQDSGLSHDQNNNGLTPCSTKTATWSTLSKDNLKHGPKHSLDNDDESSPCLETNSVLDSSNINQAEPLEQKNPAAALKEKNPTMQSASNGSLTDFNLQPVSVSEQSMPLSGVKGLQQKLTLQNGTSMRNPFTTNSTSIQSVLSNNLDENKPVPQPSSPKSLSDYPASHGPLDFNDSFPLDTASAFTNYPTQKAAPAPLQESVYLNLNTPQSYETHPSRSNWKTTSHVIESLQCTIDRLKRELQVQQTRCEEEKSSKAALQKRCTQLETQQGALRHQYETLNSVLERKERRQRDNDNKMNEYKKMVDTLEKEQSVYIKEKAAREKSMKQSEAEIEKMKIEYTIMASEVKRKKEIYENMMKKIVDVLKDMGIKEYEKKALDDMLNSGSEEPQSHNEIKDPNQHKEGKIKRVSKKNRRCHSKNSSSMSAFSKSHETVDGINVIASLEKLRERQIAEHQYIVSLHAEMQVERAKHVSAIAAMEQGHQNRLKRIVSDHASEMKTALKAAQHEAKQRETEMETQVQEVKELVKMVEQGQLKQVLAIKKRQELGSNK